MKILFHYPILNAGGAERSVLRLTRLLVDQGWNVELVLTTGGGALEGAVDPRVKLVRLRDRSAGDRWRRASGIRARVAALGDLGAYVAYRLQGMARMLAYALKRYDAVAVSLQGMSTRFAYRVVRSRVRLHWIRSDLAGCDPDGRIMRAIRRDHPAVDWYVCVSRTAKASLDTAVPEVSEKTVVVYNVLGFPDMRERARTSASPYAGFDDLPKVVTVCRLSDRAKALRRMVRVHRRLRDEGLEFYWFLVGDGEDRAAVQQLVDAAGISDRFVLTGYRSDPFPYYAHADVAAVLSYYEGLSGAVNEAKAAGLPVIATEFSGIREQIIDGANGVVVANEEGAIVAGLRRLLLDAALRARLTNTVLPEELVDDEAKVRRIAGLIAAAGGPAT